MATTKTNESNTPAVDTKAADAAAKAAAKAMDKADEADNASKEAAEANKSAQAESAAASQALLNNEAAERASAGVIPANNAITVDEGAKEKQIAVKCIADHKTSIGGYEVEIKKGEDYKMPESVATILSNAQVVIKK